MQDHKAAKLLESANNRIVALEEEVARLKAREQELLDSNSELINRARSMDRSAALAQAHRIVFNQPVHHIPHVPEDNVVRFRARLMAEEFIETLAAMFDETFSHTRALLNRSIDMLPVKVDLVALADGHADQKVILEGSDLTFGLPSNALFAEVHRSNMSKFDGPVRGDGKRLKGPSYSPPDIAKVLKQYGWSK